MEGTFGISIALGMASFILITVFFEIKVFEGVVPFFTEMLSTIAEHIGDYNTRRHVERIKKGHIIKEKENVIAKYNRLVDGIIRDYKLPLNLDSFTTIIVILFCIVVLLTVIFMKNITLSVVFTVAIFIGILTFLVMQSKLIRSEHIEAIMDAEDLICPMAREGVLNAIKKVLESEDYIKDNIRPYFEQFVVNCENNGYSFKRAMVLLNNQLGPKFDNFAKKAIIFEYNERKGMADVFLDIVDENAVMREINSKKDRIFRKMNRDFALKTLIIFLFFLYALSVKDFREFMLFTDAGKGINTILVAVICVGFAKCQALQGDLGTWEVKGTNGNNR